MLEYQSLYLLPIKEKVNEITKPKQQTKDGTNGSENDNYNSQQDTDPTKTQRWRHQAKWIKQEP